MADFIFNVAKGRGIQLLKNVKDNDPAAAVIRIYAIVTTDTDDDLKGADTMAAVIALSNTAYATNTGYSQLTDDGSDLTLTLNDTADVYDAILADQTFSSVDAGDNWTDLIVAYDPDGLGTDASCIPLFNADFVVTPNGGDIVANFPATYFYRAE